MSDRKIHFWALSLTALSFIAKLVSLIFIGELHVNLKILEFVSIATYFIYVGWLGFVRRQFKEDNGRYVFYATCLVMLDIVTYYVFKGWN